MSEEVSCDEGCHVRVMQASANDLHLTPLCRRRSLVKKGVTSGSLRPREQACDDGCHVRVIKTEKASEHAFDENLNVCGVSVCRGVENDYLTRGK